MLLDKHEDNVEDAFTAWQHARSTQFTASGGGNDEGSSYRDVRVPHTPSDHESSVTAAKESLLEGGFFDDDSVDAPAQQASDIISACQAQE